MSDALDRMFAKLPERLSIDELTDLLALSDKSVTYRWLREGRIPAIKLGGGWLILRDDIKEHLRKNYNVPQAGKPAGMEDGPPD